MTREEGFPDADELVARYARLTGRDVEPLGWFRALALWKGAIFCEAIYGRHLRGEMPHDRFAASLATGVPELARPPSELPRRHECRRISTPCPSSR